jgi:hypothetical protein
VVILKNILFFSFNYMSRLSFKIEFPYKLTVIQTEFDGEYNRKNHVIICLQEQYRISRMYCFQSYVVFV